MAHPRIQSKPTPHAPRTVAVSNAASASNPTASLETAAEKADSFDAGSISAAAKVAFKDSSLLGMLGRWKLSSTFFDAQMTPHTETATYSLKLDCALDETQWLEGVYTGKRTDGSDAFNLRFHHHRNPAGGALTLYEFGNAGAALFPNQTRTGTDDGKGTITWKGNLSNGAPFVEVWKIEADRWSFEARVDVPNGPVIASGQAQRP